MKIQEPYNLIINNYSNLEFYGGQGYYDGNGDLSVKYKDKEKQFHCVHSAMEFYNSLDCDKALWQSKPTELVLCHIEKIQ